MVLSSGVVGRDKLHAHGFCFLGEVVQDTLAVTPLEIVTSPVSVFLTVGEHRIDQFGHHMDSGGSGLVHARAHMRR